MARASGHRLVAAEKIVGWTEDDRLAAARVQGSDPFRIAHVEDWGRAEWEAAGVPASRRPAIAGRGSAGCASRVALRARGFAGLGGADALWAETEAGILEAASLARGAEMVAWVRWMGAEREVDLHAEVQRPSAAGIGRAFSVAVRLAPERFPGVPANARGRWGESFAPSPLEILAVLGRLGEVWAALPRSVQEDGRMGVPVVLAALRGEVLPAEVPPHEIAGALLLVSDAERAGSMAADMLRGGGAAAGMAVLALLGSSAEGELALCELGALAWAEAAGSDEASLVFRATFPDMEDVLVRTALDRSDGELAARAMCVASAFAHSEVRDGIMEAFGELVCDACDDGERLRKVTLGAFGAPGGWVAVQRSAAAALLAAAGAVGHVSAIQACVEAAERAGEDAEGVAREAFQESSARRGILTMWRDTGAGRDPVWRAVRVAAELEMLDASVASLLRYGGAAAARAVAPPSPPAPSGWRASSPDLWRGLPANVATDNVRQALLWGWEFSVEDTTVEMPEDVVMAAVITGKWSITDPLLWDHAVLQRSARQGRERLARGILALAPPPKRATAERLLAERLAVLLMPARNGRPEGARWGETAGELEIARKVLGGWDRELAAIAAGVSQGRTPRRKRARKTTELSGAGPGCTKCRQDALGCRDCIAPWINAGGVSVADAIACLRGRSAAGRALTTVHRVLAGIADGELRAEIGEAFARGD